MNGNLSACDSRSRKAFLSCDKFFPLTVLHVKKTFYIRKLSLKNRAKCLPNVSLASVASLEFYE